GHLLALVLAAAAAPTVAQNLGEPMPTLAPLVEKVAPAVVNISVSAPRQPPQGGFGAPPDVERELERMFRESPEFFREVRSAGSGIIVDAANGYIVTNHHVV